MGRRFTAGEIYDVACAVDRNYSATEDWVIMNVEVFDDGVTKTWTAIVRDQNSDKTYKIHWSSVIEDDERRMVYATQIAIEVIPVLIPRQDPLRPYVMRFVEM